MNALQTDTDIFFNALRKKEFERLDLTGQVYLDYTGGNLYPKSLVEEHADWLKQMVFGNPHSINPSSALSGSWVNRTRERVLEYFKATNYHCIFTQNASGALHIIAESYPFSTDSHFLLTADNHNSVNGIRSYCRVKGGGISYCRMNEEELDINAPELNELLNAWPDKKNKLFAYPAQSNVSGTRHSLDWIQKASELGWDVLLDAAAFVPTSALDLSKYQPDFVSVSFYKIFGYPTGIGCLLVKKSKFSKLIKTGFAGGTILLSAVKHQAHFLKQDHEKFEDGTVNYLGIPAIIRGLDFIESIGMERIRQRIKELSHLILSRICGIAHNNGQALIKFYGSMHAENRGGTFMMNFLDLEGSYFPLKSIEELAGSHKISLRTGCFCNPGIDELNHGFTKDQLRGYFEKHQTGDYDDFIRWLGKFRGAVRMSIGLATTRDDIERFFEFANTLLNKAPIKARIAKKEKQALTLQDDSAESIGQFRP